MGLPVKFRSLVAAAAAGLTLALLLPAQAQFWEPWGGRQQQRSNPFGRRLLVSVRKSPAVSRARHPAGEVPVVTRARRRRPRRNPKPRHQHRGDGRRDGGLAGARAFRKWLPKSLRIGIVRQAFAPRISGLIHYEQRRDVEWPQIAKEIIAAEKPKYIVMMVGNNDRQSIREKAPVTRFSGRA